MPEHTQVDHLGLIRKCETTQKKIDRDKHSSLFCLVVCDDEKRFNKIDTKSKIRLVRTSSTTMGLVLIVKGLRSQWPLK
jgi:hypothetical protein